DLAGLQQLVFDHDRILRRHDRAGVILLLDGEAGFRCVGAEMAGLGGAQRNGRVVEHLFEGQHVGCGVAGRVGVGDVAGDGGLAHGKPFSLLGCETEKIDRLHRNLRAVSGDYGASLAWALRGNADSLGLIRQGYFVRRITALALVTSTHLPSRLSMEATLLLSGRVEPGWTIQRPASSSIMARPLATCTRCNSVSAGKGCWSMPGVLSGSCGLSAGVPVANRSRFFGSISGTVIGGVLPAAGFDVTMRPVRSPLPPSRNPCVLKRTSL